jgi:hypothetical protein
VAGAAGALAAAAGADAFGAEGPRPRELSIPARSRAGTLGEDFGSGAAFGEVRRPERVSVRSLSTEASLFGAGLGAGFGAAAGGGSSTRIVFSDTAPAAPRSDARSGAGDGATGIGPGVFFEVARIPERVCSSLFWIPASVPPRAGAGAAGVDGVAERTAPDRSSSIPERRSEKMSSEEKRGPAPA